MIKMVIIKSVNYVIVAFMVYMIVIQLVGLEIVHQVLLMDVINMAEE